ncbi:MAG: sulfatase, partial [Planctomycetes bacterium]|nr:sulfatase [Planctomycetota bacterium]
MRKQKTIKGKIFRRTNIWLLIAGMIGTAAGAYFLLKPGLFSKQIRHVVLISIDTCRADYLSCYGYARPTTPNIDSVASEGLLFVNAISPVPLTLPAHCSMMTGTIPPTHGVHDNDGYRLGESHMSLAEIMRANGFKTAGFVSAFVLDSKFGLDQGFDHYDDEFNEEIEKNIITQRRGEETSRVAIKWLDENKDNNYFLFLHYYDPHAPYDPPEPFAGLYRENLYAGEIAYTDHCIGQVIAKLKSLGHYESTLIVITSD